MFFSIVVKCKSLYLVVFLIFPAALNFSHRIDHLSFGNDVPGHINPLDGTEKNTLARRSFLLYISMFAQHNPQHNVQSESILDCFHVYKYVDRPTFKSRISRKCLYIHATY